MERFCVILVRPDKPENIGLAARGMKNTGVSDLRIVGRKGLEAPSYWTAVHADDILDGASFHDSLAAAAADCHCLVASTARSRRHFALVSLDEAVRGLTDFPPETRVGLVFGNERTGLTVEEIGLANIRFHIPQVARQPSYNLGVAVTLTLFHLMTAAGVAPPPGRERPLSHAEQEDSVRRFEALLDGKGFYHETNRAFITERVRDIFHRMAMTKKDRDILLALFRKSLDG